MSRSTIQALVALFILSLLTAGCQSAPEQPAATPQKAATPTRTLRLAMTWPTNAPIFAQAVNDFAETVKVMSQGELVVEVDSANKHKAPFGVLDMVKGGQYDLGHTASYYWKGVEPSAMFFTTMPFGMTAPEQYAWFYYGGGMELMQQVYARHGVYSFPGGNTGVQMGGWFRKEINGLNDLKGLKMRVPGFAGEVLSQLGVVVTNIPPGELYTALERGTIDALEWVGPSLDLNMGFQKIAPYYYTGWHEPAAELQFLVNQATFDALPLHQQKILTTAMKATALDTYAHFTHANAEKLAALSSDYPEVHIKTFPKEILDALRAANNKLLEKYAADNPLFATVRDSQQAYLKNARAWSRISDYSYIAAAQE